MDEGGAGKDIDGSPVTQQNVPVWPNFFFFQMVETNSLVDTYYREYLINHFYFQSIMSVPWMSGAVSKTLDLKWFIWLLLSEGAGKE